MKKRKKLPLLKMSIIIFKKNCKYIDDEISKIIFASNKITDIAAITTQALK